MYGRYLCLDLGQVVPSVQETNKGRWGERVDESAGTVEARRGWAQKVLHAACK